MLTMELWPRTSCSHHKWVFYLFCLNSGTKIVVQKLPKISFFKFSFHFVQICKKLIFAIIIISNISPFLLENNTLIVMTRDFDPINEFPIHTEEFGEGIFSYYSDSLQ